MYIYMICVPNGLVEIRWFKQLNQNFDHEVKLGLRSILDRDVALATSWKRVTDGFWSQRCVSSVIG